MNTREHVDISTNINDLDISEYKVADRLANIKAVFYFRHEAIHYLLHSKGKRYLFVSTGNGSYKLYQAVDIYGNLLEF